MVHSAKVASHHAMIRESWARCEEYGLTHRSHPVFGRPAADEVSLLLERRERLVHTTQREVLPYYDNILSNTRCLILLADDQGRLLQAWGDRRFVEPAQQAGFASGASWVERTTGTNAIGTALFSGQAVHIQRDEHFLEANRYLTGAAAPIFDAERRLVGVLDVSSDSYLPPSHTLGMVKVMSQSVENRLLLNLFHDDYFQLTFNTGQDSLDSQWAGLLIFDEAGEVVCANRRADSLLGMPLARMRIESLFDLPLRQLLDQPEDRPLVLHATGRHRFHGRLRRPLRPRRPAQACAHRHASPAIELGDPRVHAKVEQAQRLLEKDIPLLIQGETGVGKEVLVRTLHRRSSRADAPLIAVNCAAIPAELIESELFGYEKGAFTGASHKGSAGLIRKANGGILFLDEIGDMPPALQARLLRVLQERSVQPLGGGEPCAVDFRLICATHRSLREEIQAGRFRQDLYYRISGLSLTLPPLRERSDRQALFQQLWAQHREPHQTQGLSQEVLELFARHPWPGNLRQASSVIQVALALAEEQPIGLEHLPEDFFADLDASTCERRSLATLSDVLPFRSLDGRALGEQLAACGGNVSNLARRLGISRNTLYKRLRAEGLYSSIDSA